jgi:hypothetical protein
MDAFLICYDVEKDQSKGTNYHKVMEYLAYGRPIVSNTISMYREKDRSIFITMPSGEDKINECFNLMRTGITKFENALSIKMRDFASQKTYKSNLDKMLYLCVE